MTTEEYRKQWLRWHRIYERKAYYILRKAVLKSLSNINTEILTPQNYELSIRIALNNKEIEKAYIELYTEIGRQHGKRIVKGIELSKKNIFGDVFRDNVIRYLLQFAGQRIVSVNDTLTDYILDEITKGRANNDSISQIVTNIIKRRSFYRFQLLRIARTETTAAAGYAANEAESESGIVLEKVWVAAQDSRTRRMPVDKYDHYNMHLKRVPDGEPFEVPSRNGIELLQFPGDPKGSAGNIIQCRCSMIKVVKRDSNGNIVTRG